MTLLSSNTDPLHLRHFGFAKIQQIVFYSLNHNGALFAKRV